MNSKVAIIGGGPSGLMCAITAKRNNPDLDIIIFEKKDIASTLLPTGGGRCNLSYEDNDIKSFAQNYPRGEKFLYSLFNQFFVADTIEFFNSIGIKTYTQQDKRIFPITDKSLDVIFALKNEVRKLNIKVSNAEIKDFLYKDEKFFVNNIGFNKLVIATGGRKTELLKSVQKSGIHIIEQKPALSSLEISEKAFKVISGVSLKNVFASVKFGSKTVNLQDDLLFTHAGVSGPLAYKISSVFSRENYDMNNPVIMSLNIAGDKELNLQKFLDNNAKREILTLISEFMPKSLAKLLLKLNNINENKRCYEIIKQEREILKNLLTDMKLTIVKPLKDGEIVSSGGIDLKEINSKTMEAKKIKNLYFCGEVVDIDGFCGGFNLQNCWSTGYVAGMQL